MDLSQFLNILETIGIIIIGGLGIYFKQSAKAKKKAEEVQSCITEIVGNVVIYIRQAEQDYKDATEAGGKKFEQVVNQLYDLVPDALHSIISKDMIENIVQDTFNEIEEYVALQLDCAVEKVDVSTNSKQLG